MTTAEYIAAEAARLRKTMDVRTVPVAASPVSTDAPPAKRRKTLEEYASHASVDDRLRLLEERRTARLEKERNEYAEKKKRKETLENELKTNTEERKRLNAIMMADENNMNAMTEMMALGAQYKSLKAEIDKIDVREPDEWTPEETEVKNEIEREAKAEEIERKAAEIEPKETKAAKSKTPKEQPTASKEAAPVVLAHEATQALLERFDEFLESLRRTIVTRLADLETTVKKDVERREKLDALFADESDVSDSETPVSAAAAPSAPSGASLDSPESVVLVSASEQMYASKAAYKMAFVSPKDRFDSSWKPENIEDTDERLEWFKAYLTAPNAPIGQIFVQNEFKPSDKAAIKNALSNPSYSNAVCIFCQSDKGPQFPVFTDGRCPLAPHLSYRGSFKCAMVGCRDRHWCHLGCAVMWKEMQAPEDAPVLPDTLFEKNRTTTWMNVTCPRCDSCFTPLSIVNTKKKNYVLFPPFEDVGVNVSDYVVTQTCADVPDGSTCVFCRTDVKQPSLSLVSRAEDIVSLYKCNSGFAHSECAHVQLALNKECVCGKDHSNDGETRGA